MFSPSNSAFRPRRRSIFSGMLLLLAITGFAFRAHAETKAEHIDQLLATWNSFNAEAKNQLAIARLDLSSIRDADGWQPGQMEAAQAWLDALEKSGVYTTTETPLGGNRTTIHFRSIAPHHLEPPASQWGDAVTERLRNLERAHRQLVSNLATEIFQFADPIWVSANTPEDLRPILQPLSRFKTEVLGQLPDISFNSANAPFPNPSFTSNGVRMVLTGENVRGLALFVLSPEPLIFPNPEKDPAEYIRLRGILADIGVWHLNAIFFSQMPSKLYGYDRRLKRAASTARRNVDRLILRAAPAAELSKAMADLEAFRIATPTPPVPSRSPFVMPPDKTRPALPKMVRGKAPAGESPIHDYRDLQKFSPSVSSNNSPYAQELYPVIDEKVVDEYRAVVDLLIASSTPTPPNLEPLRKAASKNLRQLDPMLQAAVAPFLKSEASTGVRPIVQPLSAPGDPPMTVLVKLLESISFGGKGAVAAHTILSTWQTQEPLMESRPQTIATGHAQAWNELAALPQGPAIFMAREGASRQLIQKVTGEKSEIPLPALLRQQLDKAITTTNWERCQKLLAVDQLMTLLPSDEHPEWSTMINAFELADTTTTQKEVAEARMRYLQILSSSCSDAAGPVAARLLKALPAP